MYWKRSNCQQEWSGIDGRDIDIDFRFPNFFLKIGSPRPLHPNDAPTLLLQCFRLHLRFRNSWVAQSGDMNQPTYFLLICWLILCMANRRSKWLLMSLPSSIVAQMSRVPVMQTFVGTKQKDVALGKLRLGVFKRTWMWPLGGTKKWTEDGILQFKMAYMLLLICRS